MNKIDIKLNDVLGRKKDRNDMKQTIEILEGDYKKVVANCFEYEALLKNAKEEYEELTGISLTNVIAIVSQNKEEQKDDLEVKILSLEKKLNEENRTQSNLETKIAKLYEDLTLYDQLDEEYDEVIKEKIEYIYMNNYPEAEEIFRLQKFRTENELTYARMYKPILQLTTIKNSCDIIAECIYDYIETYKRDKGSKDSFSSLTQLRYRKENNVRIEAEKINELSKNFDECSKVDKTYCGITLEDIRIKKEQLAPFDDLKIFWESDELEATAQYVIRALNNVEALIENLYELQADYEQQNVNITKDINHIVEKVVL